ALCCCRPRLIRTLRYRLELALACRCMGLTPIQPRSALMAITATILMRARRMGTTGPRGSLAECSSVPVPGITATAIAADTMDGLSTVTDARVMDTRCPMGADSVERPRLEAASLVAVSMVVVA